MVPPRPLQSLPQISINKQRLSGRKAARVKAAPPASPPPPAPPYPPPSAPGLGSSRIVAPTDRSSSLAVLTAGGGTARPFAGAGSCTASSPAGAEAEGIGSELLLGQPGGRATHVKVRMCAFLFVFFFARAPQNTATNTK